MSLPSPQTNESEFDRLYREHVRDIARYVARRVPPESRDEVVANTFVAAWQKYSTVPAPTLQWLYRIAFFEVSHELRRLQRSRKLPAEPTLVDGDSTKLETTDLVRSILQRLTPSERELIRLVHWECQSREEVAEILGVSVNLVNVRLHRTLRRIEKRLSGFPNALPDNPGQHQEVHHQ
jgi:RNA polymerase sigma-70 factor (ECF subfamily)